MYEIKIKILQQKGENAFCLPKWLAFSVFRVNSVTNKMSAVHNYTFCYLLHEKKIPSKLGQTVIRVQMAIFDLKFSNCQYIDKPNSRKDGHPLKQMVDN